MVIRQVGASMGAHLDLTLVGRMFDRGVDVLFHGLKVE